jgi:hypothetical protein
MTWHAGAPALTRYRTGGLTLTQASSVEAHLIACAGCRAELARLADGDDRARLDGLWLDIVEEVDAPGAGVVERLLRTLGLRDHLARLLAATPSLTASWLLGVAAVLAFAVFAARGDSGERGTFVFLVVAPLLPVAGVAAAFASRVEPAQEVGMAAPMHGFRLLLVRTTAVLVTTLAMVGVAALGLPASDWRIAAWLVPALALATGTLLLATWLPVVGSALVLGGGWVALTVANVGIRALRVDPPGELLDRAVAFRPTGQLGLALFTVAAALVLARRRESFDLGGLA